MYVARVCNIENMIENLSKKWSTCNLLFDFTNWSHLQLRWLSGNKTTETLVTMKFPVISLFRRRVEIQKYVKRVRLGAFQQMRYGAAAFELLFQLPQIIFAFRVQRTPGIFQMSMILKNYPLRRFKGRIGHVEPKNALLGITFNRVVLSYCH